MNNLRDSVGEWKGQAARASRARDDGITRLETAGETIGERTPAALAGTNMAAEVATHRFS